MGKQTIKNTELVGMDWLDQYVKSETDTKWQVRSSMIASRVKEYLDSDQERDQMWLADALDVKVQRVSKMLKGQENLTLKTIARLEEATGLSLMEVPGEDVDNFYVSTLSEFVRHVSSSATLSTSSWWHRLVNERPESLDEVDSASFYQVEKGKVSKVAKLNYSLAA